MKDSSEEIPTRAAVRKTKGLTVSPRKLAANRKNALKSTGPKTVRGKEVSSRNSRKHGLFARQFMDFFAHSEDPDEYDALWEGLRKQFQPIGAGEEMEVERIAQSWWRLKRAYRYENAMNRVAQRDLAGRELVDQLEYCGKRDEQEQIVIQLLQSAEDEVWNTGEIPEQLKTKVFEAIPGCKALWPFFVEQAEKLLNTAARLKLAPNASDQDYGGALAGLTVVVAIGFLRHAGPLRATSVYEIEVAQHILPNREALDRILRYESSIERNLNRALERLERMQRNRRGEKQISQTK
jgi:hypothetical protein